MSSWLDFVVFCFGIIVGSFLNVVILRYNTGRSVARGRSICFSCGKTLKFFELIPVFSYLAQKGRCRKCGTSISAQYFWVELATGVLFLLSVHRLGLSLEAFFAIIVSSLLLVIAVYDLRHKIIPDGLVFGLAGVSLVYLITQYGFSLALIKESGFVAGVCFLLFFAALWFISRGRWMGFGDAKLVLSFGWILGFDRGIAAIFLAFLLGAVVGIALLLARRGRFKMKSEIPFAPFLVSGFFIVFFSHLSMSSLLALIR